MARLKPFEWACLGVVALTFAVRGFYVLHPAFIWDSAWYLMLSRSFAERGDFWIRWTDPPETSGYWPPLFPILASPLVKLLGPRYETMALAATLSSLALCLVVLATTTDLFGRTRGFAAMAVVAASPPLLRADMMALSESTLALAVTLALYCFLKSLDARGWLAPAAVFGALAYFGKPNLGWPLVAGALLVMAAWRVRSRGWRRVTRDPVDVTLGTLALVALAAFAITRSGKLGGLGVGLIEPLRTSVLTPMWPIYFVLKALFVASLLIMATLPLSLYLRGALRGPISERDGYLMIFVALVALAAALFTSAFVLFEHRAPDLQEWKDAFASGQGTDKIVTTLSRLAEFDNMRYVTPAIVPLVWLLLPRVPFEDDVDVPPGTAGDLRRKHVRWFALAVGTFAALVFMSPMEGQTSFGRFVAFLLLACVPIAFAVLARGTNYAVQTRRVSKTEDAHRFVPREAGAGLPAGAVALIALLGLLMGFFFSWYYVAIALGALVVVSTASHRARALAMPLIMCGILVIGVLSPYPVEKAAGGVAALVPAGSTLGVGEPIVDFAGVAPPGVKLVAIDPEHPPDTIDRFVAFRPSIHDRDGWTQAGSWDYSWNVFPTTKLRLETERVLLGHDYEFPVVPGAALYVRNGTH